MALQIGQCCTDQIVPPPTGGGGSGSSSGLNEIIPFDNVSTLFISLTTARRVRFGDALVIIIEILGEDGIYRQTSLQIAPDDPIDTTGYNVDLGGLATGRAIIT